ncbi:MAG: MFS transporter [Enterococcus sp.]|nr:MFS transporter [Enterococcus sp.]
MTNEVKESKLGLDKRIITLVFTHGVNHGTLLFFSTVLLVMAADMQIEYDKLGLLVTCAFIFFGVGQLPAGIASDIIGRKNSILLSLLVPTVGCILGGLFSSYVMMAIAFSLIGLGGSFYHPSSYAMIADVSTEENRGKAFGWHGVGANIGQALTPILAGFVSAAFGWRAIHTSCLQVLPCRIHPCLARQ